MLLASAEQLNIVRTFECGQCFRWNADEHGVYSGVAGGYPAEVREENRNVLIRTDAPMEFWRDYFDLDSDYSSADRLFMTVPWLDECTAAGRGIRILRQDPWEALCSFIISQCNNISRIKGIVERLCSEFGDEVRFDGRSFRSFPPAEKIAGLKAEDLACLHAGYRAPYIIAAAQKVSSGELDLEALKRADAREACETLKALPGIGDKVANCAVLFGLHHMEAFPIDVWIRRALSEHFPPDFDPACLGPFAGLAQQYMFYRSRESGRKAGGDD